MKYGQIKTVKTYYSITEVALRIGVPIHRLRYWESQFPMLRPKKNRAGNRQYRLSEIALLESIFQLTQIKKYACPEALQILRQKSTPKMAPLTRPPANIDVLKNLRNEVLLTLAMLKGDA